MYGVLYSDQCLDWYNEGLLQFVFCSKPDIMTLLSLISQCHCCRAAVLEELLTSWSHTPLVQIPALPLPMILLMSILNTELAMAAWRLLTLNTALDNADLLIKLNLSNFSYTWIIRVRSGCTQCVPSWDEFKTHDLSLYRVTILGLDG